MIGEFLKNQNVKSMDTLLVWSLLVLSLACASHKIVQAPSGRFQVQPGAFNQYSAEQDVEIGRQAQKKVNRQMPVLPDSSPVTKYVQGLGQQLAEHAPGPSKWPFSFHVVNIKEINAFALPGGPVYVNVGTIRASDDEAQLAGVMAHEISHIVLRHSTEQASKTALAQLPLAILGAAIGQSTPGQLAQLGSSIGAQSLFLKYSRDAEREADLLGSQIMYDAGYNPYEMAEFFAKLEKEGGAGGPQFLSDHPNPGNRVESVSKAISKYPKKSYRKDSPEFERIRSEVAKLNPLTTQQVAQQQKQEPQSGPQQQTQIGDINLQDVMPSRRFRIFDHNAYQISYPDNWQVFGDASSAVTIAPPAGVAENAIAYGVIVSGVRPEADGKSLDQITQDLLDSLRRSNPGLRVSGERNDVQVNGERGKSVYLVGDSPVPGTSGPVRERDWLVTLQRRENSVLYIVFISPDTNFGRMAPAFEKMLRSVRIK
jgi:Zn-dependent protease with chaperone function